MREYKIKEAIVNTRQSIEHLKTIHAEIGKRIDELAMKFEILVEILEEDRNAEEEKEEG